MAVVGLPAPTRAGLLALAAAVLGLAAHSGAGGSTALTTSTLLVGAAVVAVTARLATAPPRPVRTAAVLAAGQLALHLAQGHPAQGHGAMPGMVAPDTGPSGELVMIGAHLAVAVLVAGGIVHADRALVAAGRRLSHQVGVAVAVLGGSRPRPVVAPGCSPVDHPPAVPATGRRVTRLHPHRGPPSGRHVPTPYLLGRISPCPIPGRRAPCPTRSRRSSWACSCC